jgi:hypothetical protein
MTKLLFKRNNVLVYSNGMMYKQIGPNDSIREGALHSIADGFYMPITSIESIGDTPNNVSPGEDRLFFNPLTHAEKEALKKGLLS